MYESQSGFLDHMEGYVRQLIVEAREDLAMQPLPALKRRPDVKRWSALEVIAHLNGYADHYLPKFEAAIHKAKARKQTPGKQVNTSILGNICLKSVDATKRKKRKLRAPKRYNYLNAALHADEVKKFVTYQEMLLRIIAKAREIDINKPTIGIQGFPFLKLSLGQFLHFLIEHQRRHMLQAQEAVGIEIPQTT